MSHIPGRQKPDAHSAAVRAWNHLRRSFHI